MLPERLSTSWNCPEHAPLTGYDTEAVLTFVASGALDATDVVPYAQDRRVSVEFCKTYATVVSAAEAVAEETESIANSALVPHAETDTVDGFGARGHVGVLRAWLHAAWTSAAK